ncbi:MAG: gliding motility-associated protein GldE [Marinifilaceae bacterium]
MLNLIILLILLIFSGLISGSETAFFSLSPTQINELKEAKEEKVLKLLYKSNKLLATILVSNNFINIGIVILSTYINNSIFDFRKSPSIGFFFQIIIVTFLLLLFGEIIPKVYASQNSTVVCKLMTIPLTILSNIFAPLVSFLTSSTTFIDKRFNKKENISFDELSKALELTSDDIKEEKDILEGIVNFSNTSTENVMTARVLVRGIEIKTNFDEVKNEIIESGFSRLPVYTETFDNIKGILYVKDLLAHIDKPKSFRWQTLIRPPYFVPETKKISDLLEEFQERKSHMAFIVDEYGGCSGIVTMEDILEEIVGEISDELDDDEEMFIQDDNGTYIFKANIPLHDFFKTLKLNSKIFNKIIGEADTLAGLILEMKGELPKTMDVVEYKKYKFTVTELGIRRINKIKFEIINKGKEEE